MNELIFMYPQENDESELELCHLRHKQRIKKTLRFAIVSVIAFVIFFALSILWNGFFVMSIITLAVAYLVIKSCIGRNNSEYYTYIEAYDDRVHIENLNLATNVSEIIDLDYNDVIMARFVNQELNNIVITFDTNSNSQKIVYDRNTNRIVNDPMPNVIEIRLTEYSYQQYYFIYIASQFINIDIKGKVNYDKLVIKKYGYSDDYLSKIETVNQQDSFSSDG